ncbi:sensor histidine kinase [Clostridium sp. WILCCON 0269]|uniref:histidine kinase n=1 Tax=Candidatus Clostridium eludens TaxID=3381663 RepID=A0ABW8SHE8_9CLOT
MFRKLKIELVLINLILTGLVLITIFSGVYILMERSFERSSYMHMLKTSQMENIPPHGPPDKELTSSESFFIKIDKTGKIKEPSPNCTLSEEASYNIIKNILHNKNPEGTVTYGSFNLRYLKVPKHYGFIIVFQDKSFDNEVLRRLIIISALVCIGSLILVFIISLFLANISLRPIIGTWKKQQDFVADASHELRTPLAVITTNLDIVLDNRNETVESQNKWLGNIKLETSRMTKLIEDLLFLVRSDSHNITLCNSSFDLGNAITESIIPFEAVCIKHKIAITSNIQQKVIFSGNEGRIKQLVAILMDNAIKHTMEKGSIEIKMYTIKNKIELMVSDTGEGISEEYLDKIFERFYKVDKSRSNRNGNFGLGLSIAKSIVKEHKGTIAVSSTVGKGSVFKIILPFN